MSGYPIFIGLIVALVMTALAPNPLWWIIAALGAGANGLVVAANGWKMPVKGKLEETARHTPMTAATKRKWLADVVPVGFGTASIGDFFIAAGVMGGWATRSRFSYASIAILAVLMWWGSGWTKGFGLLDKWPAEARRDCKKNIPIVFVLMVLGNLVNIRGCTIGELRASTKDIAAAITPAPTPTVKPIQESKYRSLGELAPLTSKVLTRLHREESDREAKRRADIVMTRKQLAQDAYAKFYINLLSAHEHAVLSETRKGPFCHVTCLVHHGTSYDRETLPEFCNANEIPHTDSTPGWDTFLGYDAMTSRPGPTTAGFHSYKLYWKAAR